MNGSNPNGTAPRSAENPADARRRHHDEMCDEFGIAENDRDNVSFHHCCNCDSEIPCEADYVPYAPNGLLWCRGCLEARGGWCDAPYGAVVRGLEPDKTVIDIKVAVTDAEYAEHGKDCVGHAIANSFADAVRARIGEPDVRIEIDIRLPLCDKVEMTMRVYSESRAAARLGSDWVSRDDLNDDASSVIEVFDDIADGTYEPNRYDDDYRRAPGPFTLKMTEA